MERNVDINNNVITRYRGVLSSYNTSAACENVSTVTARTGV